MRAREAEEFKSDSGFDGEPDPVAVDGSWLIEHQPNGSNICFIHNWGIGSTLRYLREDSVAEPGEKRICSVETLGTESSEAVESHHRVLDRQTLFSTEPEVAKEPAHGHLPAFEQRVALSVQPWVEELAMGPAKASKNHADLASKQTDVPDVERLPRETTANMVQAIEARSQPAGEQAANVSGRSCLTEEGKDSGFPEQVVRAAWRRQGSRCARCGRWLIWSHRGRDGGIGAWRSQHMDPEDRGGISTLANCVILCSGTGNCHSFTGPSGEGRDNCGQPGSSVFLFLYGGSTALTEQAAAFSTKRRLFRALLGIAQH